MKYVKITILISIFIAMVTILPLYVREVTIDNQVEEVVEVEVVEEIETTNVVAYPAPTEIPPPPCPYPIIDPTPYCEEYWFEGEFMGYVCYDYPPRCP